MAIRVFLHTLLGSAVPIETSSRLYLAQQLARCGVEDGRIPEACLQELAGTKLFLSRGPLELGKAKTGERT